MLFRHPVEHQVDNKNTHTDGDGAVRRVECRPVGVADVEIKKIDDPAESESIDKIADRTPEDQSQSGSQPWMGFGRLVMEVEDDRCRDRGQNQKNALSNPGCLVGQESEGSAGVLYVGNAEKIRYHRYRIEQRYGVQNIGLGDLVDDDDGTTDQNQSKIFAIVDGNPLL